MAQGRLNLKDFARQIPGQENLKVRIYDIYLHIFKFL